MRNGIWRAEGRMQVGSTAEAAARVSRFLVSGPSNFLQGEDTRRCIAGLIEAHTRSRAVPALWRDKLGKPEGERELGPRAAWGPAAVQSNLHTPSI